MKHINEKSKKIFEKLISKMEDGYAKIDNSKGSFMPVSIEHVGNNIYSLAHYYEQNGDLMADPEMTFWKGNDENFYPCSFRNDGTGFSRESVKFKNGEFTGYYPKAQTEDKNFANLWLNNIKEQQEL